MEELINVAAQKLQKMQELMEQNGINGIVVLEDAEERKVLRSNLMVEGQTLPLFIVLNNTVYSYIQVQLAKVAPDKVEKLLVHLNELNDRYGMLKYVVDANGNVVISCCIISPDDAFSPALMFGVLDQIKNLLEETYAKLMEEMWKN